MHLGNVKSCIFELWGGGPQGGLLTVLLFNLNSNWITDICQPGLRQNSRFLTTGVVTRPRDRWEQGGDCPPEYSWPNLQLGHHSCPRKPACGHAASLTPSKLSPIAPVFVPQAVVQVLGDANLCVGDEEVWQEQINAVYCGGT